MVSSVLIFWLVDCEYRTRHRKLSWDRLEPVFIRNFINWAIQCFSWSCFLFRENENIGQLIFGNFVFGFASEKTKKIPKWTCYQCQRPIFALNVQNCLPRMIGLIPQGDWGIKCNTSCRAGLVGQRINLKLTLKPEAIEEKHHCLCFISSIIDFPKLNENVYIFVVKCF